MFNYLSCPSALLPVDLVDEVPEQSYGVAVPPMPHCRCGVPAVLLCVPPLLSQHFYKPNGW